MQDVLADRPFVDLGRWPTPLEPVDGTWMKRDDLSGLGLGGNKLRKLEFLLGAALAAGQDTVVTTGAVQSNHARLTAAACARLGLACHLVLVATVPRSDPAYRESGNVLLDDLFGATVHVVPDQATADRELARLHEAHGDRLCSIPLGGSDRVGALGYVAGALELAAQLEADAPHVRRVVTATSSGGTLAGLVTGLAAAGWSGEVHGVAVMEDVPPATARVERLVAELTDDLGVAVDRAAWTVHAGIGPGYGVTDPASLDAIRRLAAASGILLDPVYTAKAYVQLDQAGPRTETVFLHTGGVPALFAYQPDLVADPTTEGD
ncbi:D-cysteine desulfhydrase family protein [Aeromicrobium massiliense]|uniref:D-cysteine desulfhydrase family protein n=1 Tax=Aeromicrobium massiliense TaxID=1464554 RepID=UPI0002FBC1D4|nr:D-cysteine desulfhydrase family protein [Aeromicrobium massiliense]